MGVRYVLEGSVRKTGETGQDCVQLVDALYRRPPLVRAVRT